MVSREVGPSLAPGAAGSPEKAATVRSVLLKHEALRAEGHLLRRQRPQQVRFKDLVEIRAREEPRPARPPGASPEWGADSVRRSWPQAQACRLPLPACPPGGASTAIQTSPSLQRPLRSKSACDLAREGALPGALPPWGPTRPPEQGPRAPASAPPQRSPRPPAARCPLARQHKHCAPPSSGRSPGALRRGPPPWPVPVASRALPAPASVPGQPPSAFPGGPLAQGPCQEAPTPASLLWSTTHPSPALWPHAPPRKPAASPVASQEGLRATVGSSQPLPPKAPGCSLPLPGACLPPRQAETLRHAQELLQPAAGAPPGPPPRGPGALHSQLQSLEEVLETSQQTIHVLLDVIQDLEKEEAQRGGWQSYWTGQDVVNCGACRDCACIIYSVEHDFRQQEGRFQPVLSTIEPEPASQSAPTAVPTAPPSPQEPPPLPKLPAKAEPRKARRRCFWFL
ncbi:inhibitory synaptic factor 2A-like isoform X2 [Hemicordylus capensis]|uniref:inhibitory synaptic factor 2A-like isoform X2 n=1 Tax=Hemicordylus capensis TaxID=884348 RepID=UPI0023030063|nr:inhibitory synaptic factor 2A-like isoform X2 [Hemicordylus capensis]